MTSLTVKLNRDLFHFKDHSSTLKQELSSKVVGIYKPSYGICYRCCILTPFETIGMKRTVYLLLVLLALSALTGYLLSKASLVGRVGISLLYKEYAFLKVWWQAGLTVLIVWLVLYFLLGWAQRKLMAKVSRWVQIGALLLALVGLFFTYQDFRNNLSHRWLGERFHLGGYLFWIGWILVCLFYVTNHKKALPEDTNSARGNFPSSMTSPEEEHTKNEWK